MTDTTSTPTANDNNDSNDLNGQTFGNDSIEEEVIVEENGNGKENKNVKPKSRKDNDHNHKREEFLQKYTDGLLAEAILIARQPYFLVSENKEEISILPSIELEDKIVKPLTQDMYLSRPYTFTSQQEVRKFIEKTRKENLDTIFNKVKSIYRKYIDADDFHISICAADIVYTYYQDKIGLTHYLFFVGNNDSGKSNNLRVIHMLSYRNFMSTDVTAPNIFQFLGNKEEGQGTLCIDEADNIDASRGGGAPRERAGVGPRPQLSRSGQKASSCLAPRRAARGRSNKNMPTPESKPRDVMPEHARTLPARYYVGRECFDREMDWLFARMWVCAGRAEQVGNPGDFFVRELLGERIVITRGPASVNAFYNVCRHRGTQLCTEANGTFPGSIQCPYHAWTYDLDGRLIGAPHMDEVPHFRKADYPLHGVGAALWDGHIFINLDPQAATLEAQLGALPARFRSWRMEDLRLGHRIVYDVRANWKLIVQNYNECLHCPNLHPALNKLSHYLSGENEPLQATYMGGRMDLRPGVDTMSMDGTCPRAFLPHLSPEEQALRLLLRDLSEHAAQPAPRLHAGAHVVAARPGQDDQHLRVALPSRRDAAARVRSRQTWWSSGT